MNLLRKAVLTTLASMRIVLHELFRFVVVLYFLLVLVERLVPGFITYSLNLQVFFYCTLALGAATFLFPQSKSVTTTSIAPLRWWHIGVLGLATLFITYALLHRQLGLYAIVISVAAGLLSGLLLMFIQNEK